MSIKNNPTSKYFGIKMNKGWKWFNIIVDALMWLFFVKSIYTGNLDIDADVIDAFKPQFYFIIWIAIHYGVVRLIVFAYNKLRENESKQEEQTLQYKKGIINKDWIKIKKGWIRIHIILSILLTIVFTIAILITIEPRNWLQFFILLIFGLLGFLGYWGVLYLIRFLINWVKEGFKES